MARDGRNLRSRALRWPAHTDYRGTRHDDPDHPRGVPSIVATCISGEVGEHYTEIRDGSLLQLADCVATRCMALCEEREVAMNDDIYHEAVGELAPHFAQPTE
jgi:hypothetical protein